MGMFEQSMLLDNGTGKRTSALAASLTLQVLLVAILIVIPLLYGDHLPTIRPWLSITIPLPLPLPQPVVEHAAATVSRPSLVTPRVFRPNFAPQQIPLTSALLSDDPGPITMTGNAPAPGLSTNLGEFLGPVAAPAPVVRPAVEPVKIPEKPLRVGGDVMQARLIRRVVPVYPEIARRARVSGTVRLVGVIAKDGTIQQLQVVSGNPLLVGSAVDAVRQWIYKPTLLNGVAVEVIAPIDVIFTLAQ
jgi:protein TonB